METYNWNQKILSQTKSIINSRLCVSPYFSRIFSRTKTNSMNLGLVISYTCNENYSGQNKYLYKHHRSFCFSVSSNLFDFKDKCFIYVVKCTVFQHLSSMSVNSMSIWMHTPIQSLSSNFENMPGLLVYSDEFSMRGKFCAIWLIVLGDW